METKLSGLFKLNGRDFLKGAIMAGLSALVTTLIAIFKPGGGIENLGSEWKGKILFPVIIAVLTYLSKNLLTNENDQFLKK